MICGYGSEWDPKRGQTKCWVTLDNGAGYAGYGDGLPQARLDLREQLAGLGLPLSELGSFGLEIAAEIEGWTRLVTRFPGGRAAEPAYDYSRAMRTGAPVTLEFAEGPLNGTIVVEQAGALNLPAGRVCARDPYNGPQTAFTRAVQPGCYPVFVSWAEVSGEPRRRSVLAWVKFSDAPVWRWEQALSEDEDVASLEPGQMFGCPVDSGCACFADPDAEQPEGLLDEGFDESIQAGDHLVAFTSGWGDGKYACFWGLDADGATAVLTMDVELVASV